MIHIVVGSNLPSPRLAELLYVVVTFDANNFPVPLGSAFVAESKSMTLLITADHVATGSSGTRLFVVRKMTRLTDGSLCMEPSAPIEVVLLARDATSDVAVLRCTSHVFPKSIKLCPRGEEPSIENEDRVKSYHCPIQLFVDCYMDTIACVGTDYSKLRMSSSHHYWLAGEHVHGSSGGVVVDTNGRAVGMIVSGHVVGNSGGPRLETGVIEIDSRWEKISALSDGTGPYT